jgi:hypothetical protein
MQNEEKYAKCTFLNQNKSNICKVYVFGSKTDLPLQNPAVRFSKCMFLIPKPTSLCRAPLVDDQNYRQCTFLVPKTTSLCRVPLVDAS